MSKSTSVALGNHFAEFVDKQITDGRFGNASEVIRAGLRLLEEHEMKLEALRAALIEGEQSGSTEPFDLPAFLNEAKQRKNRCG
jgi:antitoxin ParD1/3/4